MDRIAVIMGKYTPGGIKSVIMNYYRAIDKSRYQFDIIIYADSPDKDYSEIESMGGSVYRVTNIKNLPSFIYDLIILFKRNKYKIVHGYLNTLNVFAMFAAKLAGVPIRIAENLSTAHPSEKKTVIKNILKRFPTAFATHLAANSIYAAKWLYGEKWRQAYIVRNAIDLNKYKFSKDERYYIRTKYNIVNRFVVGHIGRFSYQKNHDFLLDIFYAVKKKDDDAVLLLIGYGELEESIRRKVKKLNLEKNVVFIGKTEELSGFYNAMDCFVLPSLYEGLPVVGIEAQAFGLPCVFSKEITDEVGILDRCVFLKLEESADKWADEIIKLKNYVHINDNELVQEAGYDLNTEVDKLMRYYDGLLK